MKFVTFSQLCVVLNLGLLSCGFQTHAQEYYKWVDAKGVTTYSATPPPSKKIDPQLDPTKKKANPVATPQTPSSVNRSSQVTTQTQKYTAPTTTQNLKTTTPVQNQKSTVATPSQKTTAPPKTQKTVAPVQAPKNPATPSQAVKLAPATPTNRGTLNYLKSCNGVRCTDTVGKHFNLVAGNTYLAANGAKCTKTGNNMLCSK